MADTLEGRRILLTTDAVGGVWTYTLDLARGLSTAGAEVLIVVMGPEAGPERLEAAAAAANVTAVNSGLPLDWLAETPDEVLLAGRKLAELARAQHCDLVQLHAPAFAAGCDAGMPVVSVHHSCLATWWAAVRPGEPMPEDFRWRSELVARGLRASDAVVAPSTAHAHAVAQSYGLAATPLAIRNGRAAAESDVTDAATRAPFVLTSGRLWDAGKNVAALDRAAAHLDVPVMAAGPVQGPDGEARSLPALRVLGQQSPEAMRYWLSQAPVYASAARYEPFGLGVLEAAQAGCALVLSDIPTFRELWAGACLFVPPEDDAAIAAAIRHLFDTPASLRRLSARARHRARLYTAEAMVTDMSRLLVNLLALGRISRGEAA